MPQAIPVYKYQIVPPLPHLFAALRQHGRRRLLRRLFSFQSGFPWGVASRSGRAGRRGTGRPTPVVPPANNWPGQGRCSGRSFWYRPQCKRNGGVERPSAVGTGRRLRSGFWRRLKHRQGLPTPRRFCCGIRNDQCQPIPHPAVGSVVVSAHIPSRTGEQKNELATFRYRA